MMGRRIGRVLLIQPPLTAHIDLSTEPKGVHPPIGLAYIAAVLEKSYDVSILDAVVEGYETEIRLDNSRIRYGLTFREIRDRIEAMQPDVVGVSNLFSAGFRDAAKVCSLAKEVDKDIITVIGGPHPSALPEEVLGYEDIDFVVIGEGEYSFRDLLRGMEKGDLSGLDGIAFRDNGRIRLIPKTRFIRDLDELPFPARHLLPMERYFEIGEAFIVTKRKPFTPMNTSRGCVARCSFCPVHATWGGRWRARSAENVLAEIEHLVEEYGVREIHFDDDNITLSRRRAEDIFRGIIDRKLDIVWTVPPGLALWAVDDELLRLMRESGCYKLFIAVESGDERVLHDIIRKPLDLKKVKPLVRTMRKLGIETESYFVVGMPGETEESLRRTFRFARDLDTDVTHYFFANPIPGSELWDICSNGGYFKEGFSYENIRMEKSNIEVPGLPTRRLEKMVAREQLACRVLPLIRHPLRMIRKYISYLEKDPRVVLNFLLRNLRDSQ